MTVLESPAKGWHSVSFAHQMLATLSKTLRFNKPASSES